MNTPRENGPARVLVLDNRDSFVFNLVEELRRAGAETRTVRCDLSLERLEGHLAEFCPDLVLLSPGPGRPESAGAMMPWLASDPALPVLGVCLGHQALALAAGGEVGRAPRMAHGRAQPIDLAPDPLFDGLPSRFVAARYHSLAVTRVPGSMRVIATCRDEGHELVMALRDTRRPRVGVQFHPESFLTPWGSRLLANALTWARQQVAAREEARR